VRAVLHHARSLDILNALMDRGADPCAADRAGVPPLMRHVHDRSVEIVARLLQDPRVRATVNMQSKNGSTALHYACDSISEEEEAAREAHLLLQADAKPTIPDNKGETPLDHLRQHQPNRHALIALLEQAPDAEKASLLIKTRRLSVAANSNVVAPSCLQARLPSVTLAPPTDGQNDGEDEEEGKEEKPQAPHHPCVHVWVGAGGHAAGCLSGGDGPADALVGPAEAHECRHGAVSGAGLIEKRRREAKIDEEGDVIRAWIAFLACLPKSRS